MPIERKIDGGGWRTRYVSFEDGSEIEVFVSPADHWYRRARKGEPHDVMIEHRSKGLPATRLVSIEHWRPPEEQAK